ncbi:hypothetical protein Prudu_007435 [Prunus dulcis]|uniref:Sororin C-terminal region domain-containing protein n=1 Tax=Prunus dulcis TaxID=3755 RepID=A0A4Y1R1X0_PRUDU|nr:hypothetical protein Prudu_007435 [Prunus dulcis]
MKEPERRRLRVRKPLSDCTNTIPNTKTSTNTNATATSSQSSSASTATLKRLNPKLSSATKTLVAALNPKPSAPPPKFLPRLLALLPFRPLLLVPVTVTLLRLVQGKLKEDGHSSLSKESTAPRKKKQCAAPAGKDVSMHALPQDFIEKQRAYFAEIDAFELPEEEVDSVD